MLADRPTKILLVTGSALTLVRTDHWNHPSALPIPVTTTQQRLVGVDGNSLQVQGTGVICITLAGKKFTIKDTVVDDISAEAILGMDVLAIEYCCIDVGRRILSIRSQELQLELCNKTELEHDVSQMPVTCVTITDVPAHSELEMIVETPQRAAGTWLLEGSMNDRLQVMTVCAVVCPSDQAVVARVINPTSRAIHLSKGMRLGQMERVLDSSTVSAVAPGPTNAGKTPARGLWMPHYGKW